MISEMEAIDELGFYGIEGVRFYPTDEELIDLLKTKRLDPGFSVQMILKTNIYQSEPLQLSDIWRRETGHEEKWCNFYCVSDYMKDSSERLNQLTETGYCNDSVKRATKMGYWKVTGKPRSIKAKRSKNDIGLRRTLVFYERPRGSKEIRTNWVMREFVVRYDPSFKEDFVLCRIKRKPERKHCILTKSKKRCISTKNEERPSKKSHVSINDEAQPSSDVTFDDRIYDPRWISHARDITLENTSPESQCNSISNTSHVAENISPELQSLPSCDSISDSGHLVAEASEYTLQGDPLPLAEQSALNGCSGLGQTSIFTLQHEERQPLPSCDSISDSGQLAAETPEYTSPVDPQPVAIPIVLSGCGGMDQNSSALLSPVYPEQVSPYSSFTNSEYDVLNSALGIEREFIFNPPCTAQVEWPGKETGHSTPLCLNSSMSAGGFFGGDINDVDTDTFISCLSYFFQH